jgi:cytochrome c-type biogenesis protein CcmH
MQVDMTLWALLTIVSSAGAGFLAALFLRRLDRRHQAAVAILGVIGLGIVGLFALGDGPDMTATSSQGESARQLGAFAVDALAAAMPSEGAEGQLQSPSQARLGTVDEMISRLVERLNRNPNDPEGWRMLGWSYFNTGRFAQSASAYAKAIELNPQSADFRSSRGEALVRAADGRVTDEAKVVFAQTLRLDAKDPKGRFFMGLAKEQVGDKLAALDDWIAILNDSDLNGPWVVDLLQRATELGREAGVDVAARLHPAATDGLLGMLQQQQEAPPAAAPSGAGPRARGTFATPQP